MKELRSDRFAIDDDQHVHEKVKAILFRNHYVTSNDLSIVTH